MILCSRIVYIFSPRINWCLWKEYAFSPWKGTVCERLLILWRKQRDSLLKVIWKQSKYLEIDDWLNNWGCMYAKLFQSCLALCDPMDCSPSGASVHGIPQTRALQWVAISFWGYISNVTPYSIIIYNYLEHLMSFKFLKWQCVLIDSF